MFDKKSGHYTGKFIATTISLMVILAVLSFPSPAGAMLGEPYILTGNATNVTGTSAVLNGTVNGNNYLTSAWFEFGTNTNFNSSTPSRFYNNGYESYGENISGLYPNTTYFFRAAAHNAQGTVYGITNSFKTGSVDYYQNINYNVQPFYTGYGNGNQGFGNISPIAVTESATNVSSGSAQLNSVIINQTNDLTNAWFEWGTTIALGNKTVSNSAGASPSVKYVNTLTGLSPGTTYYFRAVTENHYWRNNGSILSFVTGGSGINQNKNITAAGSDTKNGTVSSSGAKDGASAETSSQTAGSSMKANVFETGFFPGNILGWLALIILILILILLVRHISDEQPPAKN